MRKIKMRNGAIYLVMYACLAIGINSSRYCFEKETKFLVPLSLL